VGREGIEPTLLIYEQPFYRRLGLPSPIDPSGISFQLVILVSWRS